MMLSPLLLSIAMLSGQAASAPPPVDVPRRLNRIFISPIGEPFRPNGREDDTLADWFHQADLNHDGYLTVDEMQKDADRFFALLDVNHDGEIDPDEITRYETVVAPEISTAHLGFAAMGGDEAGDSGTRGGRHRGRGRGWSDDGADDAHQGGARYGLLDLPEPVVSADTNFNRGVSRAEFEQAATQRFVALDVDHQGKLTLGVLETLKPPPPATGNKPEKPPPALPDDADPGL
jgi:Ca2+-binding EF-hand superfamily protein